MNGDWIWAKFGDRFNRDFLYKTGHVLPGDIVIPGGLI